MFSNTDWDSPATLLLLVVVAANVLLPVAHFWPSPEPESRPAERSAVTVRAEPRLAPVVTPDLAKRVSLRKPTPVCRAWGPFVELEEAESLARRLQLPAEDFEVFHSDVKADPDYLVTVRAAAGREAAKRILQALKEQGIDSYPLDREGEASALAAGVFSAARRADAQQRRLVEMGYDAGIEVLERSNRVYHLLARLPAAAEPEILPLGACSDIAPLEQFL